MKFNVPANPEMKYKGGDSKVVSVRMPADMVKRLSKDAKEKNRSVTEVIQLVMDQYLQSQNN